MSTRKHYLLAVLTIILAFNFTDRAAIGMVAQDIKVDLNLSDTQLGVLSGIAFALFYAVMGIPIARWADRGNRVTIIVTTTALWSAAVALCGAAGSFVQLMLIRVVAGVGEAGCVPPSHSLLAEFFTRAERARAVSVYMQGASASLVIGYFAGGWLNQFWGWRTMFVLIGVPGLALAALALFTLRDPRGSTFTPATAYVPATPKIKDVCAALLACATFRHVLCAFAVICFFSYGTMQWGPAFFSRSFGLNTGKLGTWFAVIYGLSGVVGTYLGGEWAARHAANRERLQLTAMGLVICLSGAFSAFAYIPATAPNYYWAFGWLALSNATGVMINGPTFAVLQTLVPARMRAMSVALVFFVINLVGLGCGPWATGALSDALRPWAGEESLRYAMLLICPIALWGAWHLRCAARTVMFDLKGAEVENASQVETGQLTGSHMVLRSRSMYERTG